MSFRESSIQLTRELSKETKQSQGIFFTPKEARDRVFELLAGVQPATILEPSFGSGEFLEDAQERFPTAMITGVELNPVLQSATKRPNCLNMDFLEQSGKHDLILGNPPQFVIEKSSETVQCQTGRPNIFVQFLQKSVRDHLNDDGILAFVLPTSLFNCVQQEPVRKYLFQNTTVLAAEILPGKYLDTAQQTFALVLQKGKRNDDQFVRIHENVYLTPYYREIQKLRVGSRTLRELGQEVKTGDVVWNQEKDKLADSGTLLIYSSNIQDGKLQLGILKDNKKQYIQGFRRPPMSGKAILINRGYGNTLQKLNMALVDEPSFYAENHVNVIRGPAVQKVQSSLQDFRTQQFIQYFVGNGALSKSEIQDCLPIWTD